MKPFRFRLERVLDWRRARLELEDSALKRLVAELGGLDLAIADLEAARQSATRAATRANVVSGNELAALAAYLRQTDKQGKALRARRGDQERQIVIQRERLIEARRRVRLLEKLKKRRLTEWRLESGREIENFVAEVSLMRCR